MTDKIPYTRLDPDKAYWFRPCRSRGGQEALPGGSVAVHSQPPPPLNLDLGWFCGSIFELQSTGEAMLQSFKARSQKTCSFGLGPWNTCSRGTQTASHHHGIGCPS